MAWVPPGVEVNTPEHWPLAKGTVNHVGDPVALVVGDDRYAVVDAAEDVLVEYDPLPVVIDLEEALKDEVARPRVARHEQGRTSGRWAAATSRPASPRPTSIVERRIVNHRIAGRRDRAARRPRRVPRRQPDASGARRRCRTSCACSSPLLLGISEDRVRAIAPEVGGGFGSKLQIYGEEICCAWASRKLGRPVKWIETRSEDMATTHHGRDQIAYVRMGAKRDGTITAFHAKIIADLGAYHMLLTPIDPVARRVRDERRATRSPPSRRTSSAS